MKIKLIKFNEREIQKPIICIVEYMRGNKQFELYTITQRAFQSAFFPFRCLVYSPRDNISSNAAYSREYNLYIFRSAGKKWANWGNLAAKTALPLFAPNYVY